jgi:hypothetical protein
MSEPPVEHNNETDLGNAPTQPEAVTPAPPVDGDAYDDQNPDVTYPPSP